MCAHVTPTKGLVELIDTHKKSCVPSHTNQRFRRIEVSNFDLAREAEDFSSTPRQMGDAQLYKNTFVKILAIYVL